MTNVGPIEQALDALPIAVRDNNLASDSAETISDELQATLDTLDIDTHSAATTSFSSVCSQLDQ